MEHATATQAHSILIVEDELQLASILSRVLTRSGHRVHTVATGADARDAFEDSVPDVLVLDINLPDETGWSLLRWLRSSGIGQPRVVVVTAANPVASRIQELRPDAVLTKPFPVDALIRIANQPVEHEHIIS